VESIRIFWEARNNRERALLCIACMIVLAAILYVLLLEPAQAARTQLSVALPRLRAQAEDMRQQKKEVDVLRKRIAASSRHPDLKGLLQSSAARTSFAGAVERIESGSGERATLVLGPTIFDDWIVWIENLQREFGVSLETCRVSATDRPGWVRVEAMFAGAAQSAVRKAQ
jgi:general secretion pathway protein M